ncbi:MAG: hypothetical protein JW995_04620 [Melioribacteraceae bacterium]|nr:hypothetical protein [Melioribacteraceae bacterium]
MKKSLLLIFLFFSVAIVAQQKHPYTNSICTYEKVEDNYLHGLKSDNLGLTVSCAYYLGEIKSTKSVIPLMAMLRNGKTQEERLIAALSLIKIGDQRGIYLVSERAKFCDCERTRRTCEKFYIAYLNHKYSKQYQYAFEGDEDLIKLAAGIDQRIAEFNN